MKIIIEGNTKEIADLISALQGQPKEIQKLIDLYPDTNSIHLEAIRGMHEDKEEKSARNGE